MDVTVYKLCRHAAPDQGFTDDHAPVTKDRYDAGGKYDFSHKFLKTGSLWLPLLAHGL